MEALVRLENGITFKVEGDEKEVFQGIASVQEVFDQKCCGMCHSKNIRFRVRTVDDNKIYECFCNECGAALTYGQHKKGDTLFPKRLVKQGNQVVFDTENLGWARWTPPAPNSPCAPTAVPTQTSRGQRPATVTRS